MKKLACAFYLFFTVTGCKSGHPAAREIDDRDMDVQVVLLDSTPGNGNTYKARLIPDKKLFDEKDAVSKNAMIYKMDSCFYLQSGTKRVYASLVQPVANGITGTFEYLLEFEKNDGNSWDFVYQDKYINHKKYSLKLNQDIPR